jgi:hypothetical protein
MLPARTVTVETQSEHNMEPSFPRAETDVAAVACAIQRKGIDATGVFFLIHEFKTAPSFSYAKIGKKTLSYIRVNTALKI